MSWDCSRRMSHPAPHRERAHGGGFHARVRASEGEGSEGGGASHLRAAREKAWTRSWDTMASRGELDPDGVKIHNLHIPQGTVLAQRAAEGRADRALRSAAPGICHCGHRTASRRYGDHAAHLRHARGKTCGSAGFLAKGTFSAVCRLRCGPGARARGRLSGEPRRLGYSVATASPAAAAAPLCLTVQDAWFTLRCKRREAWQSRTLTSSGSSRRSAIIS